MSNEKAKPIKSWKRMFAPHILDRGYDYYQEGRVWEFERQENRITALVSGMEEYHVVIQLDDDGSEIMAMRCDCPYAADGTHCKHEAAVLYQLSEEHEDSNGETRSSKEAWRKRWLGNAEDLWGRKEENEIEKSELRKTIDSIPEDEVRNILFELAQKDGMLGNRLLTTYREEIDDWQIQTLKTTINSLKYDFGDGDGFIDWKNASDYMRSLEQILYEDVQPLIDRNQLEPAFALTCEVFLTISDTAIDDDGHIAMGVSTCREFWEMIAERASDDFQKTMYKWFRNHIGNDSVVDYMEEDLEEFLMEGFHSKELLQMRLGDLDKMIRRDEKAYQKEGEWKVYDLGKHVMNRINTMKELELPREEILDFCEKYNYLPVVLLRQAEEYRAGGDVQAAISVLKSGKRRDAEENRTVADYSGKLIEIYRECGDRQKQVSELLFQLTTCRQSNLQYVEELKEAVEEEAWPAFRKQILSADSCKPVRMDILEAEGMLPELMKEVVNTGSMYTLERYEKTLRPEFSDQIRDTYAIYVRKSAEHVSDRKHYRRLIKDLKKLTRYPGGRELAKEIAAQWKVTHARRPAFMDELQKAGF